MQESRNYEEQIQDYLSRSQRDIFTLNFNQRPSIQVSELLDVVQDLQNGENQEKVSCLRNILKRQIENAKTSKNYSSRMDQYDQNQRRLEQTIAQNKKQIRPLQNRVNYLEEDYLKQSKIRCAFLNIRLILLLLLGSLVIISLLYATNKINSLIDKKTIESHMTAYLVSFVVVLCLYALCIIKIRHLENSRRRLLRRRFNQEDMEERQTWSCCSIVSIIAGGIILILGVTTIVILLIDET